ncbi:ribosomal-processing cysteine protease Prp [Thermanaerosceptrum fracticalcis]|jgi:uncharacterized protein YsxB (DUF464 family)|uniref:Ribosomal processing cysteine protease Prp n=1 Tax=Thermanaerosceptrum fracticalcis TaxID=1712410 RepID=A0A7G6E428_THEFR|nr:ribosomal-processing cysteine protease Prp [Thermanaerosceptrum fracticalcis]QNB46832.1 ribosomal-processing cysteine protease Prp [Thermanaerosceptrum fracticalcis]
MSNIKRYRKAPVVIEAIQLNWQNWNEVCDFISPKYFDKGVWLNDETFEELPDGQTSNTMGLRIKTLEGIHIAREGDFIIKGVNGEFYPCKPDIFAKTYIPCDIEEGNGIYITYRYNEKKGFTGLKITGHAGYNPGNDPVCAGVSALGYALMGTLANIHGLEYIKNEITTGSLEVRIVPVRDEGKKHAVNIVFETILIGLKQIALGYPNHVKVENVV